MGQPIVVRELPSSTPGVVRFDTNRNFTGMSRESYGSVDDVLAERPPDVLARRLFEQGGVEHISIYGGMVTIKTSRPDAVGEYQQVIEGLYLFYLPGDPPPEVITS